MIQETLFNIPYYTLPTLNFKVKKKKLINLLKSYPENKTGIQPFSTNRQSNRNGLAQGFSKILEEELNLLTNKVKAGVKISDIWSVSYTKGEYHSPHNHGSCGYSSVTYIKFNKDKHIPTIFIAPFTDPKGNIIEYAPEIDEGNIIFFPSMINHYVLPNKSSDIRIILSFNLNIS